MGICAGQYLIHDLDSFLKFVPLNIFTLILPIKNDNLFLRLLSHSSSYRINHFYGRQRVNACTQKIKDQVRTFRKKVLISLLVLTPLGFASKFYPGPGAWWFNNYSGGMFYEIFWCLGAVFLWPRASGAMVAFWVFIVTSLLEFCQLWHPPGLELIRGTFMGRTLIGTSFSWWDFPYYFIGCGIGLLWIWMLRKSSHRALHQDTKKSSSEKINPAI